jgi:hypothetical protein
MLAAAVRRASYDEDLKQSWAAGLACSETFRACRRRPVALDCIAGALLVVATSEQDWEVAAWLLRR